MGVSFSVVDGLVGIARPLDIGSIFARQNNVSQLRIPTFIKAVIAKHYVWNASRRDALFSNFDGYERVFTQSLCSYVL